MSESQLTPDLIIKEKLLRNAFQVRYVDEKGYEHFASLLKPQFLHPRNKQAVLAVIEAGHDMGRLLDTYVALAGQTNQYIKERAGLRSRNAEHIRCFTGVVQCLLGMPQYKDVVMAYLRNDLAGWRTLSQGFLGGGGMHGVVGGDPSKHRASCTFSSLLNRTPTASIANLCRDEHGLVLSPQVFDQLLFIESDAHGFLMSAIANRDKEAIEGLLCSGVYLRFISREHTLMIVGNMINAHPEWELHEPLAPLILVRNHETAMTELKRMIDAKGITINQFAEMLWPEMSPMAVSHLVAYAIQSKASGDCASHFLLACLKMGFDLHLGTVEAKSGFGAALDALGNIGRQDKSAELLESFLWFTGGGAKEDQLAPLLIAVSPETLATHPRASTLLMHRYRLTGEKSLLAMGDRTFRGKALEDAIGL
jgi:hypothetical protein